MLHRIASACMIRASTRLLVIRAQSSLAATSISSSQVDKMTSLQAHTRSNRLLQHLNHELPSNTTSSKLRSFATSSSFSSSSSSSCPATADLCDSHSTTLALIQPSHSYDSFHQYGAHKQSFGQVVTLKCLEDNTLVRTILESTVDGSGKVLVIDGGGSRRCALVGDQLAKLAVKHNWSGIIVNGCIRDSAIMTQMPIHIKAIGTNPLKSNKSKSTQGQSNINISFSTAAAGGVQISPGDWIYSDEDGIVVSKTKLH